MLATTFLCLQPIVLQHCGIPAPAPRNQTALRDPVNCTKATHWDLEERHTKRHTKGHHMDKNHHIFQTSHGVWHRSSSTASKSCCRTSFSPTKRWRMEDELREFLRRLWTSFIHDVNGLCRVNDVQWKSGKVFQQFEFIVRTYMGPNWFCLCLSSLGWVAFFPCPLWTADTEFCLSCPFQAATISSMMFLDTSLKRHQNIISS